jgi:hypothetical protein
MKVNKMPFLVTMSCAIKFGTVAWLKSAKSDTILANITAVRNVYIKRGFLLEIIEADGQFEPLREALETTRRHPQQMFPRGTCSCCRTTYLHSQRALLMYLQYTPVHKTSWYVDSADGQHM